MDYCGVRWYEASKATPQTSAYCWVYVTGKIWWENYITIARYSKGFGWTRDRLDVPLTGVRWWTPVTVPELPPVFREQVRG